MLVIARSCSPLIVAALQVKELNLFSLPFAFPNAPFQADRAARRSSDCMGGERLQGGDKLKTSNSPPGRSSWIEDSRAGDTNFCRDFPGTRRQSSHHELRSSANRVPAGYSGRTGESDRAHCSIQTLGSAQVRHSIGLRDRPADPRGQCQDLG